MSGEASHEGANQPTRAGLKLREDDAVICRIKNAAQSNQVRLASKDNEATSRIKTRSTKQSVLLASKDNQAKTLHSLSPDWLLFM